MKSISAILFFTLSILPTSIWGQSTSEIISREILSSVNKYKAGEEYPIVVALYIHDSYHINGNKPTDEFLIPTTVNFNPQENLTYGKIIYPPAENKTFEFSKNPLAVYSDTIYIFSSVSLAPSIQDEKISIEGYLEFQPCNDQYCLEPEKISFKQEYLIANNDETLSAINQGIFTRQQTEDLIEKESEITKKYDLEKTAEEEGLLWTFILVFLSGLALNLTPCIYPLIPITISYFGGQTQGRKSSLVAHSILYVVGIAITYSILGMIASFTGSLFGAALQNPIVLVGIAIVFVGLALSMFDIYEIRMPSSLSRIAGDTKQGLWGSFFMGLTVGIVAAPCIGPFILALLTYVGEMGNVLLGFWLFFVLAMGLGIPFIFLGIFSGSLNKLPRSGTWMIWVRTAFGFIMIAMAIYFLEPLFPNSLMFYFSLAIVSLTGGIYLAWVEPSKTPGKVFPIVRNLVGIIFFTLTVLLSTTGAQSYIDKSLAETKTKSGNFASTENIRWKEYSKAEVEEASAQNIPMMIDFFADWCVPCKEMDLFTFSQPEVVELSSHFIMLKVDLTTENTPQAKELKSRFNIKGVPTLVFLNANGKELPDLRSVGFLEKEKLLKIMQSVLN